MKHPLVREISFALVLKIAALTALFYFFFGPAHRILVNNDIIAQHLLEENNP